MMDNYIYLWLALLTLWAVILSFIIRDLVRRTAQELQTEDVEEWAEEFEREIKLKYNELITYIADLTDRVDGVLKPFIKRNSGREQREKQLNTEEPLRKGGMIRPSEYKRYGFTQ